MNQISEKKNICVATEERMNKNSNESNKKVGLFALASFLNDFGSDMIYPVWPLFVTSFLGVNMAILGFIDGLGDAVVSISQAVSGYLSDRIRKRKVFVWTGYLFGSLSRIGYALSPVWQCLIPFRILDRAGKIRSAPRDAIVADISIKRKRGKNFGFIRMMDNLGAVFGIMICIFFFESWGFKNLFLIASIPSIAGALLIFQFIKEKKTVHRSLYKRLSLKDLGKNYKLFLLSSSFFALGSFSYSFLLIYAKEFGLRTGFVPIMYLVFTSVASISSLPFGKLSDQIGRKPVLMLSFILWGFICFSVIFVQNIFTIILTFILFGLHKGALEPVQKTFVSELAPIHYRASGLGGFQMVVGLCAFPASFLAGLFWDQINRNAPFYFSLSLTILSLIILLFVREK